MDTMKNELTKIKAGKTLPRKHWLTPLCAFIDPKDNLLRVGGRLEKANISDSRKHPILLRKGHLVDLYVRHVHLENGHAGQALTERIIREDFWIPSVGSRIKKIIRSCVVCVRWKAQTIHQQMGDLPEDRITPAPSFSKVGVDLAGPFHIKASKIKFEKVIKVWFAVFVCMVTKAVHLELVSDLSTDNFMAAFMRFCSRRGNPTKVYSDRGTNFIGGNKLIQRQWETIGEEAKKELAVQNITWKFSPSGSPNFGGLWEAAVKSTKYFIKRMVKVETLTYEEFNTLLCRIEAILNSRPLYPNSVNPNDTPAITPFLMLLQRPHKISPFDVVAPANCPVTKKWLFVYQLQQQFWERFQKDYLVQLQKRTRFQHPQRNLAIGDIVLLEDPTAPPTAWKMGKIAEIFPDAKGQVRTAKVETANKDKEPVIRACSRLVPLFPEEERKVTFNQPFQPDRTNDSEDDTPIQPRRSLRNRSKSKLTLLATVVCCLAFCNPITSLTIESLSAGIHFQSIQNVSVKAFDLTFKVKTSINMTEDFGKLDKEVKILENLCSGLAAKNRTEVIQYCKATLGTIREDVHAIKTRIHSAFSVPRNKRWIGAVVKIGGKFALKYSPHILMAGLAIHQEAENMRLEERIEFLKNKLARVGSLVTKVSEMEQQAIEAELNVLIEQQKLLQTKEKITALSSSIQAFATEVLIRYQNLDYLNPIVELTSYVEKLQNQIDYVKLPSLTDENDLFHLNPVAKSLEDDLVFVSYKIPLIQKMEFSEYIFISIPDMSRHAIAFNEKTLIQKLVISRDNQSFFLPEQALKINEEIYGGIIPKPIHPCLKAILRFDHNGITNDCEIIPASPSKNDFFLVGEDWAIVSTANTSNVEIKCEKETQNPWANISLIHFPGCTISNGKTSITSSKNTTSTIKFRTLVEISENDTTPDTKMKLFHFDPKIQELKKELQKELSNPEDWLGGNWTQSHSITIIAFLVAAATAIRLWIRCSRRREKNPSWMEEWALKAG